MDPRRQTRTTRSLALVVALAAAVALPACGATDEGPAASPSSTHAGGHGGSTEAANGNDADVAFLSGMLPHHEQAVEMSDIVLAADPPADVAAVARQIKGAQAPEIEQMNAMLAELGQKAAGGSHGGGHEGAHGGMMSDAELAALKAASGPDAARLYLEAMIDHHRGAIEAAEAEMADGSYEPAIELARAIARGQAAEIETMTSLLGAL